MKICFVGSIGGHFTQLLALKEIYEKFSTMGFLPEGFTWTANELENPENTNED